MDTLENKLPTKPSELIELALGDLRTLEQDQLYEIDLSIWHSFNLPWAKDKCVVCLAGSVMAQTLGAPSVETMVPVDMVRTDQITDSDYHALLALNSFRCGFIIEGLREMGLPDRRHNLTDIRIVSYDGPDGLFHKQMQDMVNILRAEGL